MKNTFNYICEFLKCTSFTWLLILLSYDGFGINQPVILFDTLEQVGVIDEFVSILEDPTKKLTFDEVRSRYLNDFSSESPGFNLHVQSAYWLYFDVQGSGLTQLKWVLEVLDSRHNEVDFYIPDASGEYKKHRLGIDVDQTVDNYQHKNFVLDLPVTSQVSKRVFVRFKSNVIGSFYLKVRSNTNFTNYAFKEYYLLGLYYGILFIVAVYNLLIFFRVKEKIYLFYVFYVLIWVFLSLVDDGTGFLYYWPGLTWISQVGFLLARPLLIVCFVLYSRKFLESAEKYQTFDRWIVISTGVYLLYHSVNYILEFDVLGHILFLIPFFLIYGLSIHIYQRKGAPVRFFILGNTFVLLGILIRVFKDHGVIEMITENSTVLIWSLYSRNFGMILEIVVLSVALGDRIRFLKEQEKSSQLMIIDQLKENDALSKKVNLELESKVAERTQELERKSEELVGANSKLQEQTEQINQLNLMLDLDNRKLQKDVQRVTEARIQFKDVGFEEFKMVYPDELTVKRYVATFKWDKGYSCKKCGNDKFCDGGTKFSRRCTKCRYDESVTAFTLFHKCKFPLVNALYIVVQVNRYRDDITSYHLARVLDMRKSTVWSFKQKVEKALEKMKNPLKRSESDRLAELIIGE